MHKNRINHGGPGSHDCLARQRLLWWFAIVLVAFHVSARKPVEVAQVLPGYQSIDSVEQRLASQPLGFPEGIWRFPSDGGTMVVTRDPGQNGDIYLLVALRPVDTGVRPGTVMGWLTGTGKRGVYDARIYSHYDERGYLLSRPKKFVATLVDGDTRLVLKSYGKGIEFNWWNLFPYMYRRVIKRSGNEPDDLKGCYRLFPEPIPPIEPRYL